MSMRAKDYRALAIGVGFILPNIIGFLAFSAIPLVISFFMAFTDWNLALHNMFQNEPLKFIGFDNFIRLFNERDFGQYFGNTLFLMIGIPFGVAGSLGAALLLSRDFKAGGSRKVRTIALTTVVMVVGVSILTLFGMGSSAMVILLSSVFGLVLISGMFGGQSIYRTLFYFPCFTAGVATFILWKRLYSPDNGPINHAIQPVLNVITPMARALSTETAMLVGEGLLLLVLVLFLWGIYRKFRDWRDGELGTISLFLGLILLSLPLLLVRSWSAVEWAHHLLGGVGILAWLAAFVMLFRGRKYTATLDRGMADAVILDGLLMVGGFAFIGLSNVIICLPEMASVNAGLTAPKWIADYYWAKPAILIMGFWAAIGSNNMLLYLAGLSGISQELYEAADIDGATPFQRFWHVTWPQLANVTFFILVMSIIGGLQGGFEMARTMTGNGGPAGATTTLSYYIYKEGFDTGRLGYASAVSWTLFAMVFVVTMFNWKFGNRYTQE